MIKSDYLIIGSGIAGLSLAIKASRTGSVTIVTKRKIDDCATNYAQGGIAAVWKEMDSFKQHIKDTLVAGAGLCNKEIVELVVEQAPERIKELIDWGVEFASRKEQKGYAYELGLEAGHSQRRIFHAGDFTGEEIEKVLVRNVLNNPNIQVFEEHIAIDLITTGKLKKKFQKKQEKCWGAYVLDKKNKKVRTFLAKAIILATGGAGKVYNYTSNPDVATGDGVAMGYRCGAVVSNMEFVQFHPTCLFHPKAKSFLISEAVRGEGAKLKLKNGEEFMHKYHRLKELAPRDIVARAIDAELKKSGDDCVYLDISHRSRNFLKKRFPNIYAKCLEFGIDMAKVPIPVVPAAHYLCGGIATDDYGRTSINNLFAIGETACTGLHGANRLASNSLLEAMVFSERAFQKAKELLKNSEQNINVPSWNIGKARDSDESVVVTQNWEEIRLFMWNYVGIVRTDKRLARAIRRIEMFQKEITEYYWDFIITSDLIELRNIATVSELIIRCAQKRKESRGLHYNIDYPHKTKLPKNTLLHRF